MHRTLERLDEIASTAVPLSYLCGLFLGTASYFAGVRGWGLAVAVGIGLALGSELHSFLQQRRTRASFAEYRRIRKAGGDASDAREVFRFNAWILAALVAFQCFTATAFAATNWPLVGPWYVVWPQYLLRGCIIPAFFLLSGLLIPLSQSAAAVLTRGADAILHDAVTRNVRAWRRRMRRAIRRGGDLSPLMVALLSDAGEGAAARRTMLIGDNLTLAEAHMRPAWYARLWGRVRPVPESVAGALLPGQQAGQSPTFPTGPGTPLPAPSFQALPDDDEPPSRWNMVPGVIYPDMPRQDTPATAASGQVERGKYTPGELREVLAFKLLDDTPGMSRNALMGALRAVGMGCRDDALRAIMARWQTQRRGIPVALPTRGVQSRSGVGEADERDEQPEERAV